MVLEDSYHLITVDRQRHLVGERVVEFVARFAREAEGLDNEQAPVPIAFKTALEQEDAASRAAREATDLLSGLSPRAHSDRRDLMPELASKRP